MLEAPEEGQAYKNLSNREKEILTLAAEGWTDKETARRLGIALGSVRTYWERMRRKVRAKNRAELLARVLGTAQIHLVEEKPVEGAMRSIIEHSAVAIALIDESGNFRITNPAMDSLLGLMRFSAKDYVSGFLSDNRNHFAELLNGDARFRYVPLQMKNELRIYQESVVSIKIGESRFLLANYVETSYPPAQQEAKRLASTICSMPSCLCIVSRSGLVLATSDLFAKWLSIESQNCVGRRIWTLLGLDEAQIIADLKVCLVQSKTTLVWDIGAKERKAAKHVRIVVTNRLNDPKMRVLILSFNVQDRSFEQPQVGLRLVG